MKKIALLKPLVLSTYFALGAFALISQTMLLREFFVVVFGNELIFGLLLTNWLLGIFAGAWLGSVLAEKSSHNQVLFGLSILVMGLLLPIAITATRFLYHISGTPAGTYIGFFPILGYSALFIIPISFFIGFIFPIAAKVQSLIRPHQITTPLRKKHRVTGISQIYIFEAFGSLFSGIIYTFFLVGRWNAYLIAACFTLPLVLCGFLLLRRSGYNKIAVAAALILLLNIALCFPGVNQKVEHLTVAARWRSVSMLPLTYSKDSRYQNIAVASMQGQNNLFLNTMYATVFPNDNDNMVLAAHLICQHPNPKRILIIGDAVSGLAKFLLRFNITAVVSVEIDAETVQTIIKFLPPEDKKVLRDKRFKIVIKDGRKYVKDLIYTPPTADAQHDTREKFDMVYVNVAEPSTLLLNRYYTAEFFADLSRLMNPGGVMALRLTGSENYEEGVVGDYTASVFNTVKSVFPQVVVTPGTENFFFASKNTNQVSADPRILAKRYQNKGVEPQRLGKIFFSLYPIEKTEFIHQVLMGNDKIKINTDETPIASLYFNKIVGWYAKSNMAGLPVFIEKINFTMVILLVAVFFLVRLIFLFSAGHNQSKSAEGKLRVLSTHVLLAVFAGGLASLSLELVLLYTFQNNFGDIYYIIGFIIALFMFGLPMGALASNGLIAAKPNGSNSRITRLIIGVLLFISILSLALPKLMRLFAAALPINQIIIFTLTITIGFAIGLLFPLAVYIYLGNHGKTGRTAGRINAFDHMGAAVGAFFIGTIFLPVLGVEKICFLVALFPLLAAILLALDILVLGEKRRDSGDKTGTPAIVKER